MPLGTFEEVEGLLLYEVGPIRPPNENDSLFIRVTRNCPWNHCFFCNVYHSPNGPERFSIRPTEEVIADINQMRELVDDVDESYAALKESNQGIPPSQRRLWETLSARASDEKTRRSYLDLMHWREQGGWQKNGYHAFLQDADGMIVKTDQLERIVISLKEKFPEVDRITTYARARSTARKSLSELERLQRAGLNRVHMGLESGSNVVLEYVNKGTTKEEITSAGKRVKQAGITLCYYVILGLGGRRYTEDHVRETAEVINEVNPDFVRFRTLGLRKGKGLFEKISLDENGFEPLNDDEIVLEERRLIESLTGVSSTIIAQDHWSNLLSEINGTLPQDQQQMLGVIDEYLGLEEEQRRIFRYLRRTDPYFTSLFQLNPDSTKYQMAKFEVEKLLKSSPAVFEQFLFNQLGRMI
jgi:radical SAM superfamily enzyme